MSFVKKEHPWHTTLAYFLHTLTSFLAVPSVFCLPESPSPCEEHRPWRNCHKLHKFLCVFGFVRVCFLWGSIQIPALVIQNSFRSLFYRFYAEFIVLSCNRVSFVVTSTSSCPQRLLTILCWTLQLRWLLSSFLVFLFFLHDREDCSYHLYVGVNVQSEDVTYSRYWILFRQSFRSCLMKDYREFDQVLVSLYFLELFFFRLSCIVLTCTYWSSIRRERDLMSALNQDR